MKRIKKFTNNGKRILKITNKIFRMCSKNDVCRNQRKGKRKEWKLDKNYNNCTRNMQNDKKIQRKKTKMIENDKN